MFLDRSISSRKGVCLIFIFAMFYRISSIKCNGVDPGPTPRSVASDLALHCLLIFFYRDARHKWVRTYEIHFLTHIQNVKTSGNTHIV